MMMRLSPSPTLFPYTTLFRSQHIRPLKRFRGAADKAGTRGARAKRATKAAFLPASRGIVTSFWGHRYGGKGAIPSEIVRFQRWQVMATYSLQPAWPHFSLPVFGTEPVISSGSTRRKEVACAKSRDWQYARAAGAPHLSPLARHWS